MLFSEIVLFLQELYFASENPDAEAHRPRFVPCHAAGHFAPVSGSLQAVLHQCYFGKLECTEGSKWSVHPDWQAEQKV